MKANPTPRRGDQRRARMMASGNEDRARQARDAQRRSDADRVAALKAKMAAEPRSAD